MQIRSSCVWTSMKPGATTSPVTSMTRSAVTFASSPMAMMVSPRRATSAANAGWPRPSMTSPPFTTISARRMSAAMSGSDRRLSKKRLEAAMHGVVVFDLQQQGPFVEGGAGMRYLEAQQIADRQIRSRRHGQVSMLVVEFVDDQTVDGSRCVVATFAKPPPGRGQVDVVRDVALAQQHDGLV